MRPSQLSPSDSEFGLIDSQGIIVLDDSITDQPSFAHSSQSMPSAMETDGDPHRSASPSAPAPLDVVAHSSKSSVRKQPYPPSAGGDAQVLTDLSSQSDKNMPAIQDASRSVAQLEKFFQSDNSAYGPVVHHHRVPQVVTGPELTPTKVFLRQQLADRNAEISSLQGHLHSGVSAMSSYKADFERTAQQFEVAARDTAKAEVARSTARVQAECRSEVNQLVEASMNNDRAYKRTMYDTIEEAREALLHQRMMFQNDALVAVDSAVSQGRHQEAEAWSNHHDLVLREAQQEFVTQSNEVSMLHTSAALLRTELHHANRQQEAIQQHAREHGYNDFDQLARYQRNIQVDLANTQLQLRHTEDALHKSEQTNVVMSQKAAECSSEIRAQIFDKVWQQEHEDHTMHEMLLQMKHMEAEAIIANERTSEHNQEHQMQQSQSQIQGLQL